MIIFFYRATDPARRYLVFPLGLDIFLVMVTGLASFFVSGSFPVDVPAIFWAFALLMLAPTSAAVFFSIPASGTVRPASIYLPSLSARTPFSR
jgi:hypothetical protein